MKISIYILSAFLVISIAGCNSHPAKNAEAAAPVKPLSPFEKFTSNFRQVKLPVYIPANDDTAKQKELSRVDIDSFLKIKTLIPAFGNNKDAAWQAAPAPTAKFYAEGMIAGTTGFYGFLLRKHDATDTYYIITIKKAGEFINGMCIAFREENSNGVTGRSVSINDDFSMEVSQTDVTGPKDPIAKNAFFEITPDGIISPIKAKGL